MQRLALVCISVIACFGALSACSMVPINTGSSATAPVITWVVTPVGGGVPQTLGANAQMNIQLGTQYDVSMHAKSSSGVKSLSVTGGEDWTCIDTSGSEPLGTNSDGELVPQNVTQTAKNGQAEDELFSFQELGFDTSPCKSGFNLSGGGFALDGTATNFANEQSTGHLALTILP